MYGFNTISKPLSQDISVFLDDLDVHHSARAYEDKRENCRDIYRVRTYRDAKKLGAKIEPRHPKKEAYSSKE